MHFPSLTVSQTIEFAAKTRAPAVRVNDLPSSIKVQRWGEYILASRETRKGLIKKTEARDDCEAVKVALKVTQLARRDLLGRGWRIYMQDACQR